jgi:hypothetical protein
MSFAAALILAAAAAQAAPAGAAAEADRGAQVATARVGATILRPALLSNGSLVLPGNGAAPRSQRLSRDGRVTYEFE